MVLSGLFDCKGPFFVARNEGIDVFPIKKPGIAIMTMGNSGQQKSLVAGEQVTGIYFFFDVFKLVSHPVDDNDIADPFEFFEILDHS